MEPTAIEATVDFHADGVQHGFLKLPHSHDQSAWGCVTIPITVIKNGEGKTALLTGGNHGDEYEGITALLNTCHQLMPSDIKGRVIILPMMNAPAVTAGTRTSPWDQGNMNRAFPGSPTGSVTEQIADYFTRYLIPQCDTALDIHSGGKTLDLIPYAASHRLENLQQAEACAEGARLFGAPYQVQTTEMDATSMYDTAVEQQGKVFVTTELGGGGTSTPDSIAITQRGIHNFLVFSGILQDDYRHPPAAPVKLELPDKHCYVQSEHAGIIEFCVHLGDTIKKGDLIGKVHNIERTGTEPVPYYAERDGILLAKRHLGRIYIGDTFAVIAEPV
ncbi:N(2)-acetyl-L-2,4-diaminobutanoate deacetylase DoeB [Salinivibrio sharmensis]|uniref:N-alpha-acetyl diaminobutyric acid deacetylase DoeB n=1 Tax=Salinivibrio sharmensis TaxID=390883 RepID=A0ABX3KC37_9GAMM|nr:N(2)-acetyl-L-2,4-diaminobutanoate deacetylase DoeB [Salinivibrio sharmensis]OOE86452.1 N-alpha-acetyl diaminobutyric acid deacetylase DoeB [Salinivibrio sharmensis]